jgi:hypothetical protein
VPGHRTDRHDPEAILAGILHHERDEGGSTGAPHRLRDAGMVGAYELGPPFGEGNLSFALDAIACQPRNAHARHCLPGYS